MTTALRRSLLVLLLLVGVVSAPAVTTVAGQQVEAKHGFTIDARKYKFNPAALEVYEGDVVRVTLVADDIPHSFTIDEYRIAKRSEPGKPVTFEFLADHAGKFRIYCNLTIDDGCKKMSGELNVRKREPITKR